VFKKKSDFQFPINVKKNFVYHQPYRGLPYIATMLLLLIYNDCFKNSLYSL